MKETIYLAGQYLLDIIYIKSNVGVVEYFRLEGELSLKKVMDVAKYLKVPLKRLKKLFTDDDRRILLEDISHWLSLQFQFINRFKYYVYLTSTALLLGWINMISLEESMFTSHTAATPGCIPTCQLPDIFRSRSFSSRIAPKIFFVL